MNSNLTECISELELEGNAYADIQALFLDKDSIRVMICKKNSTAFWYRLCKKDNMSEDEFLARGSRLLGGFNQYLGDSSYNLIEADNGKIEAIEFVAYDPLAMFLDELSPEILVDLEEDNHSLLEWIDLCVGANDNFYIASSKYYKSYNKCNLMNSLSMEYVRDSFSKINDISKISCSYTGDMIFYIDWTVMNRFFTFEEFR